VPHYSVVGSWLTMLAPIVSFNSARSALRTHAWRVGCRSGGRISCGIAPKRTCYHISTACAGLSYVGTISNARKIRQLKADLRRAGFAEQTGRGKGSHSLWVNPRLTGVTVVLAGQDGDDAKTYQERQVRAAIEAAQARQEEDS
jgi:predicted RNA binding protein YcfA (HicA-like mRNA interferase family)